MAFSEVSTYNNSSGSGVGSLTITVSGAVANNLLVAQITVRNGGDAFTTPTGWTLIDTHSTGSFGYATYYRIASGTSADDAAFAWTDNGPCYGAVVEYSGNATSSVLVQSSEKTSDLGSTVTTHTTNSLTPTAGNLLLAALAVLHNAGWNTPASQTTTVSSPFSLSDENTTASGSQPYAAIAYYETPDTTTRAATFTTNDAGSEPASVIMEFAAAAGGITGTGAITEGADTSAGSGAIFSYITGTGAITEAADTAAGTGTVSSQISGTGAITEAADVSAGVGAVFSYITGTGAITEAADTSSGAGTVTATGEVSGSGSITEGADTCVGTGAIFSYITGTGAITEGADTCVGVDGNAPDYFPFQNGGFFNASIISARLYETGLVAAELRPANQTKDKFVN